MSASFSVVGPSDATGSPVSTAASPAEGSSVVVDVSKAGSGSAGASTASAMGLTVHEFQAVLAKGCNFKANPIQEGRAFGSHDLEDSLIALTKPALFKVASDLGIDSPPQAEKATLVRVISKAGVLLGALTRLSDCTLVFQATRDSIVDESTKTEVPDKASMLKQDLANLVDASMLKQDLVNLVEQRDEPLFKLSERPLSSFLRTPESRLSLLRTPERKNDGSPESVADFQGPASRNSVPPGDPIDMARARQVVVSPTILMAVQKLVMPFSSGSNSRAENERIIKAIPTVLGLSPTLLHPSDAAAMCAAYLADNDATRENNPILNAAVLAAQACPDPEAALAILTASGLFDAVIGVKLVTVIRQQDTALSAAIIRSAELDPKDITRVLRLQRLDGGNSFPGRRVPRFKLTHQQRSS
jgi:hypothetical protein